MENEFRLGDGTKGGLEVDYTKLQTIDTVHYKEEVQTKESAKKLFTKMNATSFTFSEEYYERIMKYPLFPVYYILTLDKQEKRNDPVSVELLKEKITGEKVKETDLNILVNVMFMLHFSDQCLSYFKFCCEAWNRAETIIATIRNYDEIKDSLILNNTQEVIRDLDRVIAYFYGLKTEEYIKEKNEYYAYKLYERLITDIRINSGVASKVKMKVQTAISNRLSDLLSVKDSTGWTMDYYDQYYFINEIKEDNILDFPNIDRQAIKYYHELMEMFFQRENYDEVINCANYMNTIEALTDEDKKKIKDYTDRIARIRGEIQEHYAMDKENKETLNILKWAMVLAVVMFVVCIFNASNTVWVFMASLSAIAFAAFLIAYLQTKDK